MIQKLVKETNVNVLIVGAGPAGLGCAIALKTLGVGAVVILDRDEVGASFLRWPKQMRFITPSFYSNPYGQPDLNAITPDSAPGLLFRKEHLSGREYASYLQACVNHYELDVRPGCEVTAVEHTGDGFRVQYSQQEWSCRFLIWAAGEFGYPGDRGIQGAELCVHNTKVQDWDAVGGIESAVIGGAESGIDAAINLAVHGKSVHLFSRGEPWRSDDQDPSRALSPYTLERLRHTLIHHDGAIQFHGDSEVKSVTLQGGIYRLSIHGRKPFEVSAPPILATGFKGSLGMVTNLFDWRNQNPVFSEESDESTITPGLFYSGPQLLHRNSMFCFIYKFRSRFGVIAKTIAERLRITPEEKVLTGWMARGFMTEDLSCCTDCQCAVTTEENPEGEALSMTSIEAQTKTTARP